jgi:hypothetical protein
MYWGNRLHGLAYRMPTKSFAYFEATGNFKRCGWLTDVEGKWGAKGEGRRSCAHGALIIPGFLPWRFSFPQPIQAASTKTQEGFDFCSHRAPFGGFNNWRVRIRNGMATACPVSWMRLQNINWLCLRFAKIPRLQPLLETESGTSRGVILRPGGLEPIQCFAADSVASAKGVHNLSGGLAPVQ